MSGLIPFITESNRIEGIRREPLAQEIDAHRALLRTDILSVHTVEQFVAAVAGAPLRAHSGMNVSVGGHLPPPGSPRIRAQLAVLLGRVNNNTLTPFQAHTQYETLHPFMDGNGRSGRAVWAWHMERIGRNPFNLPFLHAFYYQSLDACQERR